MDAAVRTVVRERVAALCSQASLSRLAPSRQTMAFVVEVGADWYNDYWDLVGQYWCRACGRRIPETRPMGIHLKCLKRQWIRNVLPPEQCDPPEFFENNEH